LLPSPRRPPPLPKGLRIQHLTVRLHIRGPLVLCVTEARLTNQAQKPWQGRLDAADLLWPHPVASTPGAKIELAPGKNASITSVALGSMQAGGKHLTFALLPAGWTTETISQLTVDLTGDPATLQSGRCTTRQMEISQRSDALPNRAERDRVSPQRPIVLEFSPPGSGAAHAFVFEGPDSSVALGAWRPGFEPEPQVGRSQHFLVAFDAAARYEKVGRSYAHTLTEQITRRLSRRVRLLVAAYDGQVKLLPSAGPRAGPMGRERMMAALWELEADGSPDPSALLDWCASFPAREPSVAFVVTDGRSEPDEVAPPPEGSHPRIFLLHTNQTVGSEKAGRLCASLGGAVLDLPAGLSAEEAALLALRNVSWPGYRELDLRLNTPPGAAARLLTSPGTSSNAPILWITRAGREEGRLSGRLRAATRGNHKATNVELTVAPHELDGMPEGMEARLAKTLKNLLDQ
jgi:hypothetical protein